MIAIWLATMLGFAGENGPMTDVDIHEANWVVVNDGVMGGRSAGQVSASGGAVVFQGILSLENNGGFSSTWVRGLGAAPSDARGIQVQLRGDGREYGLTMRRRDVPIRAGSYRVGIQTTSQETITVDLPLAAFEARSFGRPMYNAPNLALQPQRITEVGLILADKNPGPFRVEVLSMRWIRGPQATVAEREQVRATLFDAISSGVQSFNDGNHRRCRMTYRDALRSLITQHADQLLEDERKMIPRILEISDAGNDTQAAWLLRRAIDATLER